MTGHARFVELAASSIDFELTAPEAAALTAHLAVCDACRREAGALHADARALRRLSEGAPSPLVRERILETPRRHASPLAALAAAALLVVVAVVGGLSAGALITVRRDAALPPVPTWTRLAAPDVFPAGSGRSGVLAVASAPDLRVHLVAVGTGAGDGRVWLSNDGLRWYQAPASGLESGRPVAAASTGGTVVAVGDAIRDGDSVATAWTSTDATIWHASDASAFAGSTGLSAVAASPARIVVAGSGRSGGGLPIWSSATGDVWTPSTQTTRYTRASVTGLALGGPGFVAVGYDDVGAVVWISADGVTWRRVDDASFAGSRITAIAATPAGLVAVGGDREGAVAWTSLDGSVWSETDHFGLAGAPPTAVAATPFGVVAVGGATGATRAWVSTDGRDWRAIHGEPWSRGAEIDGLVAYGPDVVVVGATDGRASVWVGRVGSASD